MAGRPPPAAGSATGPPERPQRPVRGSRARTPASTSLSMGADRPGPRRASRRLPGSPGRSGAARGSRPGPPGARGGSWAAAPGVSREDETSRSRRAPRSPRGAGGRRWRPDRYSSARRSPRGGPFASLRSALQLSEDLLRSGPGPEPGAAGPLLGGRRRGGKKRGDRSWLFSALEEGHHGGLRIALGHEGAEREYDLAEG